MQGNAAGRLPDSSPLLFHLVKLMFRYAVTYLICLVGLFSLETSPWAQTFTVGTWTQLLADLSGGLLQSFDDQVLVRESSIINGRTGYAVAIQAGCNGVEAALILVAAILAYPATWSHKLAGMLIGVVAIQLLNVIRIISLYYLGEWSERILTIAHLYVWPGLIIFDALIIFLIWTHWQGGPQQGARLS